VAVDKLVVLVVGIHALEEEKNVLVFALALEKLLKLLGVQCLGNGILDASKRMLPVEGASNVLRHPSQPGRQHGWHIDNTWARDKMRQLCIQTAGASGRCQHFV
jgi:hypothetical protein